MSDTSTLSMDQTTQPDYIRGQLLRNGTATTSTSIFVENEQAASVLINLLIPPILVSIGVSGNCLTVLTMRTKFFRKVSTSVYLKAGAINDILALLISLIAHWLYVNFPNVYIRTDMSHIMCKFFNFYGIGNNDLGILTTTLMTSERALVIAYPFGAAKYCSTKRAWKLVVIILVFVMIKDSHFLFTSDIVPADRTDRLCDVRAEDFGHAYNTFSTDVWPWLHLFFVVFCGTVIVVSNCIILRSVRHSAADKHKGGHTWRHLLPMLLGESVLLIMLTFPFTIHLALLAIRLKYHPDLYSNEETAATENLVFSITFYMLYANKCANFFMYCATGSRFKDGLRSALMTLCCKRKWQRKFRKTIHLATISTTNFTKSLKHYTSRTQHDDNSETYSSEFCSESDDELDVIEPEETKQSMITYM